ncbi:bifunctional 4-hydroxy-2-oxoglutarate aldolase/2-dehydro-3-deoxy-phosphogluconate aldolase [Microbacterium sp. 179-I 3D3 NHS]|uniref:bifunctional 4-hydroxy-2-oxoglutarate aldolase/2-dehydro-3-deoxy-phosphogluconate aldolase n=1 Tax=unclassified Microbacterium TaxID=2609290 RepID=UPI0039A2F4CF
MTTPLSTVPSGVILVLRTDDREAAAAAARAAARGGIDAVEITLTVPDAVGLIAELGDLGVPLGVGTVLSSDQVAPSVAAGASFIVAPGTNAEVIRAAQDHDVPMIAGALTPTEVETAHRLGSAAVKVFPAGSVGGPLYIGELKGPLPHIPLVVSGGVTRKTAPSYFAAGAHAVCVGRDLFTSDALARRDIDELALEARRFLQALGS